MTKVSVDFGIAESLRQEQLEITAGFSDRHQETLIACRWMQKKPLEPGWQKTKRKREQVVRRALNERLNIGVRNDGELVDVDVDDVGLLLFVAAMLPKTASYGRYSKRGSHLRFRAAGKDKKKTVVPSPGGQIEVRAGKHQTLSPGSVHPRGELYEWEDDCDPVELPYDVLVRLVRLTVVARVLVGCWSKGMRDDVATAVTGLLVRLEYQNDEIDQLFNVVCRLAHDEEPTSRLKAQRLRKALKKTIPFLGFPGYES